LAWLAKLSCIGVKVFFSFVFFSEWPCHSTNEG